MGHPAGWPIRMTGGIVINEKLTKDAFQSQLRALLPGAKSGAEDIWADFARECVEMKQYVDFMEEPDETAHSRWYDTLLAGFVLLKRDFGEDTATKICNLSLDNQCLYPYEMQRAGQDLHDGGNVDTIFRLMEEGRLESSPPSFPKLRDIAPQMLPEPAPELPFQL